VLHAIEQKYILLPALLPSILPSLIFPSYVREVLDCGKRSRVMSAEFPVIAEFATVMAPSATVKKIFFPYLTRSLY